MPEATTKEATTKPATEQTPEQAAKAGELVMEKAKKDREEFLKAVHDIFETAEKALTDLLQVSEEDPMPEGKRRPTDNEYRGFGSLRESESWFSR